MTRMTPSKGGVRLSCLLVASVFACVARADQKVDFDALSKQFRLMSQQLMLQQLFVEERIRSDGQSGIKQVRENKFGTKSYHSETHAGKGVCAIHNHANNDRTVGMGEFIGVLNGVEFRTRHNDYRLKMPSISSKEYHAVDDIPFPDVPPEVTSKKTVPDQIAEMREWFKAWANQNRTVRDYTKYFKPVLCYVEGAWQTSQENIEEPFFSDRHHIDASTWLELQNKIRFTSYSGRKNSLENFAYLPTTVMSAEDGEPIQFAQWTYRIMCHPLKNDLPLSRLRLVDDLGTRMAYGYNLKRYEESRAARFEINPKDSANFEDGFYTTGLLDKLMEEIPGKDNYQANIQDRAFDEKVFALRNTKKTSQNEPELNAGYYHRRFRVLKKGAMGLNVRKRGYSDQSLFMAMTTNTKVAGMKMQQCTGRAKKKTCKDVEQRWTYAFPLEIIYMTPLLKWNPWELNHKGNAKSENGMSVTADGRNGGRTKAQAYNGTNSKTYFRTPDEFFTGDEKDPDPADTSKEAVGVLDSTGNVRMTRASGTRIFLPEIPGVGIRRLRYPIMPIHGEGSSVWKRLQALEDITMKSQTFRDMFEEKLAGDSGSGSGTGGNTMSSCKFIELETSMSQTTSTAAHKHTVQLTGHELDTLRSGATVTKITSTENGHQHRLGIQLVKGVNGKEVFKFTTCDGKKECKDRHSHDLIIMKSDLSCFDSNSANSNTITVEMTPSEDGKHRHTLTLTKQQQSDLEKGKPVTVRTSTDAGHSHQVTIILKNALKKPGERRASRYKLTKCDSFNNRCGDGHTNSLWAVQPYVNKEPPACTPEEVLLETTVSAEGAHRHYYCLDEKEQEVLLNNKNITVTTTTNSNHEHVLNIALRTKNKEGNIRTLKYTECDSRKFCSDGHSRILIARYP